MLVQLRDILSIQSINLLVKLTYLVVLVEIYR